jgi:hypothetical protein
MEKRYQVFVSSTYADLKEERQSVIQTLMGIDCIPAGMELFPAMDEEQFQFIKRVIDDCDYYILIIGGRYGSTTSEGISYTEKEYDYAVSKGMKIIAFLHDKPEEIASGKSENDSAARERLQQFREKASKGRLVKFWSHPKDLPALVAMNLPKTIRTYPAIGWVRADKVANEDLYSELNQARKENSLLKEEVEKTGKIDLIELANFDENFTIHGKVTVGDPYESQEVTWEINLSWKEIFSDIAPYLMSFPNDSSIKEKFLKSIIARQNIFGDYHSINSQDFETLKIQLKAYGLINLQYNTAKGNGGLIWSLTPAGEALMLQTRTIKAKNA